MNKDIKKFLNKLKIISKNEELFRKALTHKSANPEFNNEKLEFLGDRVIGLVLSKKIIDLYPEEREGVLDKRFAKLVNKNTCARIAWSIELQKFISMGDSFKTIKNNDEKILSDSCEALIGAIYIDKGFSFVQKFVLKLWKQSLKESNITVVDPKTKLQEHSLKIFKKLPNYKIESYKGPSHKPTFKVSVNISGSKKFTGFGKSKKDAQQNAAKKLLESI